MTMEMGFPVEMELPWESLGNWEWLQLSNGNGNGSEHRWLWEWTLFLWEKFPRIFFTPRLPPSPDLCTVLPFHHNLHNILKDDC